MLSSIRKRADVFFRSVKIRDDGAPHRSGLYALYRKELADHLRSKRFLIILALILLTSCASIYGALSGLSEAVESDPNNIFLKLFTLSGESIPSFLSFIALLGPFVGLTLGFDAINSERSEGTLNRLVSQPIYRDAVINGKFLAGATIIFIMVFAMGLVISAIGLITVGIPPTADEAGRIVAMLFFTSVYICFWLALSIFFSVVCRHAATSAMIVIALWIFFALFMSLVVNIIMGALYPTENVTTWGQLLDYYDLQYGLNRLSPYYLYSEAISTIMDPTVRTTNVILPQQLSGAISGYLSLGQSLLLVWPHLVGLLALTIIMFALSYICFMRKEIRAR
ncbi:MAG TPA: ABC transporter permease [Candidatus Eisenbergiella intestinipullorum]|nr:ABC transporter permease [Candidatus Eisenbergiella intestinipullorum]